MRVASAKLSLSHSISSQDIKYYSNELIASYCLYFGYLDSDLTKRSLIASANFWPQHGRHVVYINHTVLEPCWYPSPKKSTRIEAMSSDQMKPALAMP